jgi:single-strand DNA-binding protein
MSNDLNQCNFIGRLGSDPEIRYTKSGDCVCNFSIAVGSQWKNKEGVKQESTEWINVVAFRGLGEICAQYLKKGFQIYICGKFKTEKYQDKETGIDRYSTKIVADSMQMLGSKSVDSESTEHSAPEAKSSQKPAASPAVKGSFDNFDDYLPFRESCLHYGLWRSM